MRDKRTRTYPPTTCVLPLCFFVNLVCIREKEDGEIARTSDNDNSDEDCPSDEEDDKEDCRPHRGYFRRLLRATKSSVYLLASSFLAILLCLLYIIGSILLWFIGIWGVIDWVLKNWKEKKSDIPEAMPGQEQGGDHWKRAWQLTTLRNHGAREDRGQEHFHVLPFLKSKTGVNVQHLARLTKTRDEKSKSEEELIEVDRKLAGARIDLDGLSENIKFRAKQRATQRWEDASNAKKERENEANTAATPAGQPGTAGGDAARGGGAGGRNGTSGNANGGAAGSDSSAADVTPGESVPLEDKEEVKLNEISRSDSC